MVKLISFFGLTALSLVYALGFIYDSSYLDYFGVHPLQLFASPAEYLAIGGVLILSGAVKWFTAIFFVLGLFGCSFKPFEGGLNKKILSKYIDIPSIPFILFSLTVPGLILFPGQIIGLGKNEAKNDLNKFRQSELVIKYVEGSEYLTSKGVLMRNRNGLALIYDSEKNIPILLPVENIMVKGVGVKRKD